MILSFMNYRCYFTLAHFLLLQKYVLFHFTTLHGLFYAVDTLWYSIKVSSCLLIKWRILWNYNKNNAMLLFECNCFQDDGTIYLNLFVQSLEFVLFHYILLFFINFFAFICDFPVDIDHWKGKKKSKKWKSYSVKTCHHSY